MRYAYPAIFEHAAEGGYIVSFPDLPGCYSQGDNLADAIFFAQKALAQWLIYLSDKNIDIPVPSPMQAVRVDKKTEFVNLVSATVKEGQAVKRTVSIPKWMDQKVVESGLSLSRVLQETLNDRFA